MLPWLLVMISKHKGHYCFFAISGLVWLAGWLVAPFHSDDWNFATNFGAHPKGQTSFAEVISAIGFDYFQRSGRTADVWARALFMLPDPIWRTLMAVGTLLAAISVWVFFRALLGDSWKKLPVRPRRLIFAGVAGIFFLLCAGNYTLVGSAFIWMAASIGYVLPLPLFFLAAWPFAKTFLADSAIDPNTWSWLRTLLAVICTILVGLHLEIWASCLVALAIATLIRQRGKAPLPAWLLLGVTSIVFLIQVAAPGHYKRSEEFASGLSGGGATSLITGMANGVAGFFWHGLIFLIFLLACLGLTASTISVSGSARRLRRIWLALMGLIGGGELVSYFRMRRIDWLQAQPHQGIRNPRLNFDFPLYSTVLLLFLAVSVLICLILFTCHLPKLYRSPFVLLLILAIAAIPIPLAAGETIARVYMHSYLFLLLGGFLVLAYSLPGAPLRHKGERFLQGTLAACLVTTLVYGVLVGVSAYQLSDLDSQCEQIRAGESDTLVYPPTLAGGGLLLWNRPIPKYHQVLRQFHNLPAGTKIVMQRGGHKSARPATKRDLI